MNARIHWTDEKIREAILALSVDGVMPTSQELAQMGKGALSSAIQCRGGFIKWANDLGLVRKKPTKAWSPELIEEEIRAVAAGLNRMPTNSELSEFGRCDLANQISKKGGFVYWADRLGFPRVQSDSDTGWEGEDELTAILASKGFTCEKTVLKAPYDIKVNGVVRIDVKSAKFAEYGVCKGWFYRVGKDAQADVLALFQLDTRDVYFLPWNICPSSNVTISQSGGKYAQYKNRYDWLLELCNRRQSEAAVWLPN